jgi:hypothetical protein
MEIYADSIMKNVHNKEDKSKAVLIAASKSHNPFFIFGSIM